VVNIVNYYDIIMLVEPKRVALKFANDVLFKSHIRLTSIKSRLVDLQSRLEVLTGQFNLTEKLRIEAKNAAEHGETKLELAHRLTRALGSETSRWTEDIKRLDQTLTLTLTVAIIKTVTLILSPTLTPPLTPNLTPTPTLNLD
jgi:dynein heavy chain